MQRCGPVPCDSCDQRESIRDRVEETEGVLKDTADAASEARDLDVHIDFNHHPLTRALSDADLKRLLEGVRKPIDKVVAAMPSHQQFLDSYCKAPSSAWEQMYARARQHERVTGKVAGVGGDLAK